MNQSLFSGLHLHGFLSFGPKCQDVQLSNLSVLIGPNGVGKSNFIEAIELLHATPADFSGAIRVGGTAGDWMWRGGEGASSAWVGGSLEPFAGMPELRYGIEFTETGSRLEIIDEVLEEAHKADARKSDVRFYYRFQHGRPAIRVHEFVKNGGSHRVHQDVKLKRETLDPQQSVFSQRKDPDIYPEITAVAKRFGSIQIFREWMFGRSAPLRRPQAADLPADVLLPQLTNLGLVLNDLEHRDQWARFGQLMRRFLPRYTRLTTKIVPGGAVQINLHEDGLAGPIPATRLSDGTLRFIALLAILLNAESSPLICIEEPELGLHPDAVSLIAELLVEASEKTQIVVTTHSDVLVSALTEQAESVLVCDYGENGTEMKRLEAAKLKFWLDKYRLGEIWRLGKLGGNL